MNGTLMERARIMLSGYDLEKTVWAYMVIMACYLINRSPTLALVGETHMEVWTSKKPSHLHLMFLVVRHMVMCLRTNGQRLITWM